MITYDPAHRGRIKHELMQLLKSIGLPLLCDLEKIDQREINDLHELAAREKKEQEDRDALIHREKNIHSMEQELKDKENDWLVERAKLRRADAARQKETEKRFELAQQRKKQQWGKQAAKAKEKELEAKRKEEEWAIREREMEKKLQEKWASMEEQIRVLEREGREREQELDAQLASERTELEAERREVLKLKKELADKIKNATNVAATAADDNNR